MTTFTESNRKAFDELSSTYDTKPWQIALSAQVTEALRARASWISPLLLNPDQKKTTKDDDNHEEDDREVKLLDFASGTGNASKALAPYFTSIRGIDISTQMVKSYNIALQGTGFYALEGDLFAAEGPPAHLTTPEFSNFDVIIVSLGFHHFENPKLALERFYERLKPITGVLVIVDFLPFSSSSHSHSHSHSSPSSTSAGESPTIKHHGFTPEVLQELFTKAGFTDFDIAALKAPATIQTKSGETSERTIFIAKGRKLGSMFQRFGNWVGGMQESVGGQLGVPRKDEGEGWNPGVETQQGGGVGWNVIGGVETKEERVVREETRGWNGFR